MIVHGVSIGAKGGAIVSANWPVGGARPRVLVPLGRIGRGVLDEPMDYRPAPPPPAVVVPPTVVDMERFVASLVAIGQRLRELHAADAGARFVIDSGLHGLDLWTYLDRPRPPRTWQLYTVSRPELRRAELAGQLRAAYDLDQFQIARGVAEEGALRKAIAESTRDDAGERVEVVALSLAVVNRRPPPPRVG